MIPPVTLFGYTFTQIDLGWLSVAFYMFGLSHWLFRKAMAEVTICSRLGIWQKSARSESAFSPPPLTDP